MSYELARELKMSRQRFLKETTSTEFNEWVVFFDLKLNQPEPIHYYLAQLALMVYSIGAFFSKKWKKATLEDFLIKFKTMDDGKTKAKAKELTESEKALVQKKSKMFWGAILNMASKKKQRRQPREPQHGQRVSTRTSRRQSRSRN